jgi:hypothetical protein
METEDDDVLRIGLYANAGQEELGGVEKVLSRSEDVDSAIAELADGLASLGIQNVQLTRRFDADGVPTTVRPYSPR